jgi:NAD-dependent SIR2 family protein deacetylase
VLKSIRRLKELRPWPELARHPSGAASANKTVFFLGAGASFNEGVPLQMRLLDCARRFCAVGRPELELSADWDAINEFLERLAPGVDLAERSIEDCLTFLDKADVEQEVIAGTEPADAKEPRRALLNCIVNALDAAEDGTLDAHLSEAERNARSVPTPMTKLGRFLNLEAHKGDRGRWAVISTNWDTTLDRALGRGADAPIVDYCSYTIPWERYYGYEGVPLDGPLADVPCVWKRPLKLPTIKLLKLHGSLNWLWCPTCSRLFVSPDENIGLRGTSRSKLRPPRRVFCPECRPSDQGLTKTAPLLREVVVTPTMIKRLDMVHLKMMWYNALVEISEARNLVFIGYSAPPADYEVRYMLAKACSTGDRGRVVRVVTAPGADMKPVERNYQSLLGGTITVTNEGVDSFVDAVISGTAGL